jgi:uncharacterized protein YcaQ
MKALVLSSTQARKIILHAAGLASRASFGKGVRAVYKLIDHLGFIQIDTNYVVERAHHHAIFSRVPEYKMDWLTQLQEDGQIFEFWTYATGYIPMNDFRFSLPVKASFLAHKKAATPQQVHMMKTVLDRIGREGPLMARDFEYDRVNKNKGWWDWRPSKVALEHLHLSGKLMTLRKKNFEKVYDLTENVLPANTDTTMPTDIDYSRYVIRRALQALGVAYQKDIAWRSRYVKIPINPELAKMVESGEVCQVTVAGIRDPLYMLPEYRSKKITLSQEVFILSPFDILNVYRHRLRNFFQFDYQVECFVPAAKRKYGYFALPVLFGDTFIARLDAKAERKGGLLRIFNLHFEPMKLSNAAVAKLAGSIRSFARFNQCREVIIEKSNSKSRLKSMQRILAN